MKFGLRYPPEKINKMRTKRLLEAKKIPKERVTALIEIPNDIELLKNELEKIGNVLIPVDGDTSTPDSVVKKFKILDRLFRKAIREKEENPEVVNFLLANLSTDEIQILRENQ
ncbi:MAG: hypothetical protein ACTSQI_04975 [Candidatus Helarchaeota archaeon]